VITKIEPRIKATATLTVTLEIPAPGIWGPECTVGQIQKQAVDEVMSFLNRKEELRFPKGTRVISTHVVSVLVSENDEWRAS